jgi:hypothetical protein
MVPQMTYNRILTRLSLLMLLTLCALLAACGERPADLNEPSADARLIAGAWVLQGRMSEESETPASERIMRLVFTPRGTFRAHYRGDASQQWIRAGQGGFAYSSPNLTLFWENGATANLLVTEQTPDRMKVHHGRNLVPLKDQDPDEIFVRESLEKGPTRGAS